jgi:hypothetical protein
VAVALLCALILAVCLSPRIRLGFLPDRNIDLRLQDLLLIPSLVYLFLSPRARVKARLAPVWGRWFDWFVVAAAVVTVSHLALSDEVPTLLRLAFAGRTAEIFVLATVVAGLYVRAGTAGPSAALRSLHLAAAANVVWVLFQEATNTRVTMFGDVGDQIESYGPKLIGEASAFGAGSFFTFLAVLAVAEARAKVSPRWVTLGLLVSSIVGCYLTQSRVNLLISLALCLIYSGRDVLGKTKRILDPAVVALAGLAATAGLIVAWPHLSGRLSLTGLEAGLQVRIDTIWEPLWQVLLQSPLIGVGPGGLTSDLPRSEAHNIILRSLLDFGLIGGTLFLATFVVIALRAWRVARSATGHLAWAGLLASAAVWAVLATGLVQDSLTAVTSTHLAMAAVGVFAAEWSKTASWVREPIDRAQTGRGSSGGPEGHNTISSR